MFKKGLFTALCGLSILCTPISSARAGWFDWLSSEEEEDAKYSFTSAKLVSRSLVTINDDYVDADLIHPEAMFIKSLEWIEKSVPCALVQIDEAKRVATITAGTAKKEFSYPQLKSVYDITPLIKDVFSFIEKNVPSLKEKDKKEIEYATINGMLSTLDPHSVFLSPKGYEELNVSTSGSFGGLGIVISIRDRALTIISPISGTPAAKAGLKAMDKITRIGDESTVNMELEDAVDRMRGEPGTKVKIWVQREGWTEPKMFTLTRELIAVKSVTHKLLDNGIGYINLKHFQRDTSMKMAEYFRDMESEVPNGLRGLILDLRDNPGGLLDQAIQVSDFFLKKGVIVMTEGRDGDDSTRAYNDENEPECPIIILINSGSASASEIVAGALKNNNRAMVMGEQSFGKGSVQIINSNFPMGTALKLTIAQYLTPGNISIQNVGISPDIQLTQLLIDKDALKLTHTDPIFRESNWENSLNTDKNAKAKAAKPSFYFSYIEPKKDNANKENDDDVVIDYQIELAANLLNKFSKRNIDRTGMLKETGKMLEQFTNEQDKLMQKEMQNILVDWRKCPEGTAKDSHIKAAVKFDLVTEDGRHEIKGGDKVKLKVLVTNKSNTPICQLKAKTVADSGIFNNREFAFGYVGPKSTRAWEVPLEIPGDIYPWNELVDINFEEQFGRELTAPGLQVKIDSLPAPSFTMQYALQETFGNGDGDLRVGEKFNVVVKVKNTSNVDAEDVLLNIKNMGSKELLLEQARATIGKLKAGEETTATLKFEVKHFSNTGAQIKLFVSDMKTGEFLTTDIKRDITRPKLSEPAQPQPASEPKFTTAIDNPLVIIDKSLLGNYTEKPQVVIKGRVTDKDKLLDVYIYHNNQKFYFKNFSDIKANDGLYTGQIEAPVTLKEGPNIFTVIARESEEIIRRQTFAIYYKRSTPRKNIDSELLINLP